MTSLQDAFTPILSGSPAGNDGAAVTGDARARVEASIRSQLDIAAVERSYEAILAERAAASMPEKRRIKSFATEAIGASRIVEAFRGTDVEIARVTAEIQKVSETRAAVDDAGCDAPLAHDRFIETLRPFMHPSLDRMRELIEEYVKLRKQVMLVWLTDAAVAQRDLDSELDHLVDERELLRELFVVADQELVAARASSASSSSNPPQPHTCPICLENPRDTAFAPCGHTVCSVCADKLAPPVAGVPVRQPRPSLSASAALQPMAPLAAPGGMLGRHLKCPTCRREVSSVIKLFW